MNFRALWGKKTPEQELDRLKVRVDVLVQQLTKGPSRNWEPDVRHLMNDYEKTMKGIPPLSGREKAEEDQRRLKLIAPKPLRAEGEEPEPDPWELWKAANKASRRTLSDEEWQFLYRLENAVASLNARLHSRASGP